MMPIDDSLKIEGKGIEDLCQFFIVDLPSWSDKLQ
jgi:hypothetical protein